MTVFIGFWQLKAVFVSSVKDVHQAYIHT